MKRTANALIMALLAVSMIVVQTSQSQARKGRHAAGIAAGVIGLGLLGLAAEAEARRRGVPSYYGGYGHGCYPGPVECEYFERRCFYNEYGDEICPAPARRCIVMRSATKKETKADSNSPRRAGSGSRNENTA